MVRVEFFGIPRVRVGLPSVEIEGVSTLGGLLAELNARYPSLDASWEQGCRNSVTLGSHYIANLDGLRFARDVDTSLEGVTVVLIFSADAGGC